MKKDIILRLLTFDILTNLLASNTLFGLHDVKNAHNRLLDANRVPDGEANAREWNAIVEGHRDDAVEDMAARLLLAGRPVTLLDADAEDVYPARGVRARLGVSDGLYDITLDNVAEGLARAFDGTFKNADGFQKTFAREGVRALLADEGDFDADMADTLMQVILFDEAVYA